MTRIQSLAQELAELGYPDLTADGDSISIVVSGIDLSDASRSTPEREGTGPFATLDDTESYIPDNIVQACKRADASVTVLGSGGYSENSHLHLYITLCE